MIISRIPALIASLSLLLSAAPALAGGTSAHTSLHLFETPSTCGDASASVLNAPHLLIGTRIFGDPSTAGFEVTGIKGQTASPYSFITSKCDDNLFWFVAGTSAGPDGPGTWSVTTTGCHEGDGVFHRPDGHGFEIINDNILAFINPILAPNHADKFVYLFVGQYSAPGPNSSVVGQYRLNGHPASVNTHSRTTNNLCQTPELAVAASGKSVNVVRN